jgi:hypothetical protein
MRMLDVVVECTGSCRSRQGNAAELKNSLFMISIAFYCSVADPGSGAFLTLDPE